MSYADEMNLKLLRLFSTKGIKTREEMKGRVLELAQAFMLGDGALSLRDTNKRFSKPLRASGATLFEIAHELVSEGRVYLKVEAGKQYLIDKEGFDAWPWPEEGTPEWHHAREGGFETAIKNTKNYLGIS